MALVSIAEGTSGVLTLLVLAKRLPVHYRYTLTAVSYAFSGFLFIGLPPFLFSLFTRQNSMYYPIIVFALGWVVQLIAIQVFYKKTAKFVEPEKTEIDRADYKYA